MKSLEFSRGPTSTARREKTKAPVFRKARAELGLLAGSISLKSKEPVKLMELACYALQMKSTSQGLSKSNTTALLRRDKKSPKIWLNRVNMINKS